MKKAIRILEMEDSNPISKEFRLKKVIRIPQKKESNLDSRMCKLKNLKTTIQILMERILILIPVRFAHTDGFESLSKRFKSQVKKEVKLKAIDSNP